MSYMTDSSVYGGNMNSLPLVLHWQPTIQFLRQAVTMRTALLAAGFLAFLSLGLVAAHVSAQSVICSAGEHKLVYPVYDRKGIIIDHMTRCGDFHRGCTLRAGATNTYDCSPFMAPKGTLTKH